MVSWGQVKLFREYTEVYREEGAQWKEEPLKEGNPEDAIQKLRPENRICLATCTKVCR